MFPATVAALMVLCFSATLFWPNLRPALTAGVAASSNIASRA